MSEKTPTSNVQATKMLPPLEMMVTRRKNAQSQRQLRKKDRSMTRITQLLMRSPPSTKNKSKPKTPPSTTFKMPAPKVKVASKSPKKLAAKQTSLLKSAIKKNEPAETSTEYYPNNKKRLIKTKKIMLKPKHELKVVDGLNKRKRTTPQSSKPQQTILEPRASLIQPPQRVPCPQLSFTELVRTEEETQALGDEDLMEILTCPSPVWWEDPPDVEYDEDPIWPNPLSSKKKDIKRREPISPRQSTRKLNKLFSELINKADEKERHVDISKTVAERFARKRFGLENILCTIKSNKLNNTETNINDKQKTNYKSQVKSGKRNRGSENSSFEEDIFSDVRDDVLIDLENLDIPMERSQTEKTILSSPECVILNTDSAVKSNSKKELIASTSKTDTEKTKISEVEDKFEMTMEEGKSELFFPDIKTKKYNFIKHNENMSPKALIWTSNTGDKKIINLINDPKEKSSVEKAKVELSTGNINVPKQLPPLQKFSKVTDYKMLESPTLPKFENSELEDTNESSSNVSCEFDVVSDTNVEFVNEDQESDIDIFEDIHTNEIEPSESAKAVKTDKHEHKLEKTDSQTFLGKSKVNMKRKINKTNDDAKSIDNKQDCIVVYKIIDNTEDDVDKSMEVKNSTDTHKNIEDMKRIDLINDCKEAIHQNGNINDFFKKCKAVNRKISMRKVSNINKDGGKAHEIGNAIGNHAKKPIAVSESKIMNYCLKCSSIFDTSSCIYCCNKKSDGNHNLSGRLKYFKTIDT